MLDANDVKIISDLLAQNRQEIHEDMVTLFESDIDPKLRLLAEGHETLLGKITPENEIESMKADIVVLKEAVRQLSARLNALQRTK